jgi:anti-sigma regulatory factor (Ser/Thr protein kinase)
MAEPLTCCAGTTHLQAHGRPGDALEASGDGIRHRRQAASQPLGQTLMDEWPLLSHLELGALPGAVACARLHARLVLSEWGLSAIAENAKLLVSELMTNATQASPSAERIQPVGLWLSSDRSRLLILVQDTSRFPPEPTGGAGYEDERGRGLLIVEAISAKWGWDAQEDSSGKVVWALIE